jgi:hypothetical protein
MIKGAVDFRRQFGRGLGSSVGSEGHETESPQARGLKKRPAVNLMAIVHIFLLFQTHERLPLDPVRKAIVPAPDRGAWRTGFGLVMGMTAVMIFRDAGECQEVRIRGIGVQRSLRSVGKVNIGLITGWGELLLPWWLLIKGVNVERWEKRAAEFARQNRHRGLFPVTG